MQTKWCQNIEVEIKFCLQSRSFTLLYSECVSPAHKVFFIFYFMPLCSTHYEYGSWTMSYLFYSKRRGFCSYIEVRQQITCIEFSFVSASGNLLEFHNVYELDLHFYYGGLLHICILVNFDRFQLKLLDTCFNSFHASLDEKNINFDMYNSLLYYEG